MTTNLDITDHQQLLMKRYGVTTDVKVAYRFKQFRYTNLDDALKYAILDSQRKLTLSNVKSTTD